MSATYYLRAIALTVLSFATGLVIIGFSQGFVLGFAATSDSVEEIETVAVLGGVAVVLGSLVAVVGLFMAMAHYIRGADIQEIENEQMKHARGVTPGSNQIQSSPVDSSLQVPSPAGPVEPASSSRQAVGTEQTGPTSETSMDSFWARVRYFSTGSGGR